MILYNVKGIKLGERNRHIFFVPEKELSSVIHMLNDEGFVAQWVRVL